jgi:cholest-4-en-3-one 26-monooxygenase
MMIEMDDPQHLLRRRLVNSGFTRKRVKDLKSSIGSLCDALIDAVCERGECDFVWDLAAPLPMAVIGPTCSGCFPRSARCSSNGRTTWSAS